MLILGCSGPQCSTFQYFSLGFCFSVQLHLRSKIGERETESKREERKRETEKREERERESTRRLSMCLSQTQCSLLRLNCAFRSVRRCLLSDPCRTQAFHVVQDLSEFRVVKRLGIGSYALVMLASPLHPELAQRCPTVAVKVCNT
jgi:hypothetical protein